MLGEKFKEVRNMNDKGLMRQMELFGVNKIRNAVQLELYLIKRFEEGLNNKRQGERVNRVNFMDLQIGFENIFRAIEVRL